jgi:hypothetical protein
MGRRRTTLWFLVLVLGWESAIAFRAAPALSPVARLRARAGPLARMHAGGTGNPDRRRVLRATAGALASALAAVGVPIEVGAICGAKPASWEFWIPWNEELITVGNSVGVAKSGKRSVFYRVVGDVKNENGSKDKGDRGKRHLMLVVPDKFKDHEYLTTLEALVTSDRRVVLYDAMGTGQSEPLQQQQKEKLEADDDVALEFAVGELTDMWATLKEELKVDQVHVFGHGFGARVANEFAKANPKAVTSLVLASPPDSMGKPEAKQVTLLPASLSCFSNPAIGLSLVYPAHHWILPTGRCLRNVLPACLSMCVRMNVPQFCIAVSSCVLDKAAGLLAWPNRRSRNCCRSLWLKTPQICVLIRRLVKGENLS